MVAKVSISVADPSLLAWAKEQAEREGKSLSAVFTEAVRRDRQRDARMRVEQWLGDVGVLTPEKEAEIIAEQGEPSAGARAGEVPARPAKRSKRVRRKRGRS
jgi:hypothetical protein